MSKDRTFEDFLKELEDQDLSVAKWAREHKLASNTVWAIGRGQVIGRSGEARRAMKLMGLPLPSARREHPHKVRAAARKQAAAAQGAAA